MAGPLQNGFPSRVYADPAPAEPGDLCGANPRAVMLGNPGMFIAPALGLVVGNFAWADTDTGAVSQGYVAGRQIGLLKRGNNALISSFLGIASYVVPVGFLADLFVQGDFWVRFAAGATPGQNVFADPSSGAPIAAAPGSTPSAGAVTASQGAAFTGVIASNVLTTSSVTGVIRQGDTLNGAGVTGGTLVGAQLGGTPGGAGTYTVVHGNVGSVAMTTTSYNLDVTAVSSGVLGVGSLLTGSGVGAGTRITAQQSGTPGGIGVYTTNTLQQFASTAVAESAILTPWKVNSVAAAGELAKISTWG